MTDENRRTADFDVRSKILSTIDETDDKNQRNILMLMFGVIEVNEKGLARIEKKIDAVLKDETAIKRMALDGHYERHASHHDWLERHILSEDTRNQLFQQVSTLTAWADKHIDDERVNAAVCEWGKAKMAEEAIKAKDFSTKVREIGWEIARNSIYLILGMAVYAAFHGFPFLSKIGN